MLPPAWHSPLPAGRTSSLGLCTPCLELRHIILQSNSSFFSLTTAASCYSLIWVVRTGPGETLSWSKVDMGFWGEAWDPLRCWESLSIFLIRRKALAASASSWPMPSYTAVSKGLGFTITVPHLKTKQDCWEEIKLPNQRK